MLSALLHRWIARAANRVSAIPDGVLVSDGEVDLRIERGYTVATRSRGLPFREVCRIAAAPDLERWIALDLAPNVRLREGLPRLPLEREPRAGYHLEPAPPPSEGVASWDVVDPAGAVRVRLVGSRTVVRPDFVRLSHALDLALPDLLTRLSAPVGRLDDEGERER